jgi:hypothetical protein
MINTSSAILSFKHVCRIPYFLHILGPTLSTSTSSFEALDPHDPNLSRLATTMFQKTADYLFGELTVSQV